MSSHDGYVLVEKIKGYDGNQYKIMLDKQTGKFHARDLPAGEWLSDASLPKLREQALSYIRKVSLAKFEPVIVVERDRYSHGDHTLSLSYERYFVADIGESDQVWKAFTPKGYEGTVVIGDDGGKQDDTLEGSPGPASHRSDPSKDAIVLPYTPERWAALRSITKGVQELNRRLLALIENKTELDKMLGRVAKGGMPLLLGGQRPPKEK